MLGSAEFSEFDLGKRELRDRLAGVGTDTRGLTDERCREVMMKLTDRTLGRARARGKGRQLARG